MQFTVNLALFGWIPFALLLFLLFPARRAALLVFVLGFLFLPEASLRMPGVLPDYNKLTAVAIAVLLCATVLDLPRVVALRPHWADLPVIGFCCVPLVSALTNGQGVYDALGALMHQTFRWGAPYVVGRLYFGDRLGLRMLAVGIVLGGLIYLPFCAFEIRMSPRLHHMLYGYTQHVFTQARRWGGWRPMVFLQHGIAVGMWMCMATLLGTWLWLSGTLRRWEGVSMLLLAGLAAISVLCRSTGALGLMGLGAATLAISRVARTRGPLLLLTLLPILYVGLRAPGLWSGRELVQLSEHVSAERAVSLETRLYYEDLLAQKARMKPVFGWGPWGSFRVTNEEGQDRSITDSLWIITFGKYGTVGLVLFLLVQLVPVWLLLARSGPPTRWTADDWGPGLGTALVVNLAAIDYLFNAMYNPVFALLLGSLTGVYGVQPEELGPETGIVKLLESDSP